VLRVHLHGHPLRFDDILANLPQLVTDTGIPVLRWWFWRHHDPARPDSDQHLVVCLRLRAAQDYGTAAAQIADWAHRLRTSGLLADLNLGAYQPPLGAFGHGTATQDAAEEVLATDSAAAIAQIWWATRTGTPTQAIAAASMADLAASLAATPEAGLRRLLDLLPQEHGKLDRELSETALGLVGADGRAQLRSLPDGQTVTRVWNQRRAALGATGTGSYWTVTASWCCGRCCATTTSGPWASIPAWRRSPTVSSAPSPSAGSPSAPRPCRDGHGGCCPARREASDSDARRR
jgi:lantibiotic biosynthesis protein